jgi:hypothetical protein
MRISYVGFKEPSYVLGVRPECMPKGIHQDLRVAVKSEEGFDATLLLANKITNSACFGLTKRESALGIDSD